jgi:hypothetical protein
MKTQSLALFLFVCTGSSLAFGQTDSTGAPAEELNFDDFGDADDKKVKTFATQKVLYLSPTKLISVGYEAQAPFDLSRTPGPLEPRAAEGAYQSQVNRFGGLRLGVNAPVISRSNFILNLGLTYWNTDVGMTPKNGGNVANLIADGLRSTGVSATVFKPFDIRRFLLVQANADASGDYRGFNDLSSNVLTYSGTAIYGWKRDDNFMWGLGLTRTYRAGQVLHLPVLYYNRTFSPKWGVEAILPARANLRRSFGTTSLLMFGYEIEGNAFYLRDANAYLRRGELKPRVTYERKLAGFVWLSAQVGWRYNWRFDVFRTQNPVRDEQPVVEYRLGNPLYVNVSLNLVSP